MLLKKLREQDSWDLFHFVNNNIVSNGYIFSFFNDIVIKILYNISTKVIFVKVIFLKDLKKQGKKNEIKEVSDGYATNYLIKNGYAVKYTKESSKRLDTDIKNNEIRESNLKDSALKLKDKLEKEKIVYDVSSGVGGKVFGTISSKQIVDSVNKLGYNILKKQVKLDMSINTLGCHLIKIELYKGIIAELEIELRSK